MIIFSCGDCFCGLFKNSVPVAPVSVPVIIVQEGGIHSIGKMIDPK
jgi:uncharacterized ion transporter superfamily protein YfcC